MPYNRQGRTVRWAQAVITAALFAAPLDAAHAANSACANQFSAPATAPLIAVVKAQLSLPLVPHTELYLEAMLATGLLSPEQAKA